MASPGSDDDGVVSAAAAAATAAAAVVCCMCGDHGLLHELFRCNICLLRTQHRYCSDLYPRKAGPYGICNWCLRQGGAVGGGGDSPSPVKVPSPVAGTKRRINDNSRGDDDRDNDESAFYGCSRSAFSADPGRKPIKKPKKGRERAAVQRPEPPVVTTVSKKTRAVQPGKPRFKVKVQRYKLLAEVIC